VTQQVVILAILGLLGAYEHGRRDDVAHLGAHASVGELSGALASPDRGLRLAAIEASTSAGPDAWALLAPLAERARERDRRVAAAAARAAVRIATRIDRRQVLEWELPVDELNERLATWREIARDDHRWPDVRVLAMETATLLWTALGDDAREAPFDLSISLADPEPEVRRAAIELLPIPLPAPLRAAVAERVTADPEPTVAIVAAQALCTVLTVEKDPSPLLAALGDGGLARIRALVLERDVPPAAVVDAARCLAADPSPQSAAALRALRRGRTGP